MLIQGAQPPKSVKFAQCPGIGGINPQKTLCSEKRGENPQKKRRILKKKKGGNPSTKSRIGPTHKKNEGKNGRSAFFLRFWPFFGLFYVGKPPFFFVEPHFFQKKMLERVNRAGTLGFPSFLNELRMLRVHHVLLLAHTASSSAMEGAHPGSRAMQGIFQHFADQFHTEVANILNKDAQVLIHDGFKGRLRRMRHWLYNLYGIHEIPLRDQRRHLAMTAWLVAPQGTFVVDKAWRTTMRIRLHLPTCVMTNPCRYVPSTTNQPCRAHVDEWGRHAQNCCRQAVQARHHTLRNLWSDLAKSAGWHSALETGGADHQRSETGWHPPNMPWWYLPGWWCDNRTSTGRQRCRGSTQSSPTQRATIPGRPSNDAEKTSCLSCHVAGGYLEDAGLDMAEKICSDLATKLINLQGHTVPVAKHSARHRVYGSLMRALAQHEVRVLEASCDLL